jgi:hypothetical protein
MAENENRLSAKWRPVQYRLAKGIDLESCQLFKKLATL